MDSKDEIPGRESKVEEKRQQVWVGKADKGRITSTFILSLYLQGSLCGYKDNIQNVKNKTQNQEIISSNSRIVN